MPRQRVVPTAHAGADLSRLRRTTAIPTGGGGLVTAAPPGTATRTWWVADLHGTHDEIGSCLHETVTALAPLGWRLAHETVGPDRIVLAFDRLPSGWLMLTATGYPEQANQSVLFAALDGYQVSLTGVEPEPGDDWPEAAIGVVRHALGPFSDSEREVIRALNPRLLRLAHKDPARAGVLNSTWLVLREHLLLEKLNLLGALFRLGLDPARTHVLRKVDRTRYWQRIVADLSRQGVHVHPELETDPSCVARGILTDIASRAPELPVVLVDDGGDLISAMVAMAGDVGVEVYPVETTTKGMVHIRRAGLEQHVVDLASCRTKKAHSRQIAVSCVYRFRELMQHAPLEGEWCHVVGFGQIGRQVAQLLTGIGLSVSVSDVMPAARTAAQQAGYPTFSAVAAALTAHRHRYVFGCSGQPSVTLADIDLMSGRAVLCSISSQDLRPVVTALHHSASSWPLRGVGTGYRRGDLEVVVLADGHAVNLHLAEGVPEPDFDGVTTLVGSVIIEQAVAAHRGRSLLDAREVTAIEDELAVRHARR
jgi:hypothetical protein